MKTHEAKDTVTLLPPPPAPTARDANPWPVSETNRQPGRTTPFSIRRPQRSDRKPRPRRSALGSMFAIGVAAFILVTALIQALRGDSPQDWGGVAVTVFFLVMFVVSRLRSSRRRSERNTVGNGAP